MSIIRRAALPALAAALVAGCGSPSNNAGRTATSTTTATTVTAAPTPTGPDLSTMTGKQILAAARRAMLDAGSVRVKGTLLDGKDRLVLDIRMSKTNAVGSLKTAEGGLAAVVVNKAPYVRPDDTFWKNYGGANPAVLAAVSGKWVKPKSGDPEWADFLGLFDLVGFAGQVLTPDGAVTKTGSRTVNGQPTLGVTDSGTDRSTTWVAATGTPYPLLAESKTQGRLTFSEFGRAVSPTAPAKNQIVDLGTVGS